MLARLHNRFSIAAYTAGAEAAELCQLSQFSQIIVPDDYKSIVAEMTEIEILIDNTQYFRIWSPSGCIEMNTAYKIQDYMPNSLAIGLDVNSAKYISASLTNLLLNGEGAERI